MTLPAGCVLLPTDTAISKPRPVDGGPRIAGCPVFPRDNIWNQKIDRLPVHPRSRDYVASIGSDRTFHPDFGSGEWPPGSGKAIGIPYMVVDRGQSKRPFEFKYAAESDPGPYPVPPNPAVEGGSDRHVLLVQRGTCKLFEIFDYHEKNGRLFGGSGAIFDLNSNKLRPDGWTSADAAGLPIFPGLVRYEEVAAGKIAHAIRFTAPRTQKAYVWPGRHYASHRKEKRLPPLGQHFRLKASYDISKFSPKNQVILRAMQEYGIILADNGSAWFLSGAPDQRWNNSELRQIKRLRGRDFEAVDVSGLMADRDSGRARK